MGRTLADAVRGWVSLRSAGRRPATVKYNKELEKIILDNWPGRLSADLEQITECNVGDFVLRVAHYSSPRFNALVGLLKSILPQAARQLRRRKVSPKLVHLPNQEEFASILQELDKAKHGNAGLMVRFLALTGLRISEARRLCWQDVTERGILVPPLVTKNGRARMIPWIGELRSVVDRLRRVSDGIAILPQSHCRKALHEAARRAGVKIRLTHHDLRRLFATRVIESGVDLPTAARWMGHSDGGALLGKTYFHLMDRHSEEMASRVSIQV